MNPVEKNGVSAITPDEKPPPKPKKKPYSTPVLTDYGDLPQITKASTSGQKNDGGMGGPNMSQ